MQKEAIRVFDGSTAIITGGASGIGRGISEELAKLGCEVVLADLQIELAQQVALEICTGGGKAIATMLDVTNYDAVKELVQQTHVRTGRLDYMFNNAGIGIGGNVDHYGIDDWNLILDVNMHGVINGVQAVYGVMKGQGFGHIVNTASLAGIMPSPGMVSYATTKYAIVGLSTSMRAEAAKLGIRVSVLCPGFVRTPILNDGGKFGKMLMPMSPDQKQKMLDMVEKFKPISPNIFARKALKSVAKNKAIIVVPAWWKAAWLLHRLFPSLGLFLAQKSFQDMHKKLGIE